MKCLLTFVLGIFITQLPLQAQSWKAECVQDSLFFVSKKELLTARWNKPFSYTEVRSKHAPLGPYLGNGDVGVIAFTSDNSQTLKISKVDFVTDGWADWAGEGAAAVPVGAVSVSVEAPVTSGFSYQMDQLNSELRMTTATTRSVEIISWMGMEENVVVMELRTASSTPLHISVSTYAENESPELSTAASLKDEVGYVIRRTKTDSVKWVSQAAISTKVLGASAEWRRISDAMVQTDFTLTNASPVQVVISVSGGGKADDARLEESHRLLAGIHAAELESMKQDKERWWKDMWTRSYVETGNELLNRHYLSSIYLLASAHNRHSPVCGGMYGVWNMDDYMNYHGDIHLNYNSQAGFYSVFSANRLELALPFYKSIELLIPEGKRRAKMDMELVHPSLKGKSCRGILFPVSALGIGEFYCQYWQQTVNAPFCLPLFNWYYEYTGDEDFLRQRAYPYFRLIGDFYEDYLQKEAVGGSYRYTLVTGAHEGSWDVNPSSDLCFVQLTFELLMKYSKLLGVDASLRKKWNDILTHLPEYKVTMPTKEPNQGLPIYAKNEDGWDWPNHVIQLHPVFPCEVLNLHSDSTALQLARNTLYYYEVDQKGFTHCMNELGLSAFIMGARMGFDPKLLIDNMEVLIKRAGQNFLIADGHHCTEKTTVIETINSMMLQSVEGVLHLFPCWIDAPASFTRLRAKGAFVVSADYDGRQVTRLEVLSEKGGMCRLKCAKLGNIGQVKCKGKKVPVKVKDGILSFSTRQGERYTIL